MENKNIIIILIAIIIVLSVIAGALFLQSTNAKEPTIIKITSDKEQYEGGELSIKLTDLNKTPISKEIVNITITNKKGKVVVDDVVKTDSKGKAQLDLDLKKGEYTVNVTYVGNENYTGNNTSQKLTIEEAVTESVAESSSTSSSSSDPFEGATWHKRTHWDDGTPTQGEVYLVETTDGQLWTYDNGNYYPGPN